MRKTSHWPLAIRRRLSRSQLLQDNYYGIRWENYNCYHHGRGKGVQVANETFFDWIKSVLVALTED